VNLRDWKAHILPFTAAVLTAEIFGLLHLGGIWIGAGAVGAYVTTIILYEVSIRLYVHRMARKIIAKRGLS
jgi:hypothetical protein